MFHGALAVLRQKGKKRIPREPCNTSTDISRMCNAAENQILMLHLCFQFDKLLLEEADVDAIAAVAGLLVATDLRMCGSR